MKKALFIIGPTSVGKTDLAFKLSSVIPSVLISADSVQVYRGADIISGKDRSVKTFLLDILSPNRSFSVRDFVERVKPLVEKAYDEQKIPIFVGGTGFYSDALFSKIDTLTIPPDKTLREKLKKLPAEKLQEKLKNLSRERFNRMNSSDANNKRRLVRAIEVAKAQGPTLVSKPLFKNSEALIIGIKTSMDVLKKRIVSRVDERIRMGAVSEAEELFRNYKKLSPQLKRAVGYKQLFNFLEKKITLEEAIRKWIIAERQLAKKQMTWFKRNKNIVWFDIGQKGFEEDVLRLLFKTFTRIVD